MLEQWVGKTVTYYVVGEESYYERTLVKIDARGIYVQDDGDASSTYFIPFGVIRSISYTAE